MAEKRVCQICGTIFDAELERCPLCETPYEVDAAQTEEYDEYDYDEEQPVKSRAGETRGARGFKVTAVVLLAVLLVGFGLFIAYEWVFGSPSIYGQVKCTGLYLAEEQAVLTEVGETYYPAVHVTPEDVTELVVYTSADETVATVDEYGKVVAVAEGETEIVVTCGSYTGVCTVICEFTEE